MHIKSTAKPSAWKQHPLTAFFRRTRKGAILWTLGLLFILCSTSLASVYYGMVLYRSKAADSFDIFFENAIKTKLNIIPNYVRGMLSDAPERLVIDVKHKHLQRIAYKRQLALDSGILLTSPDDFVPAHITSGDKTVKVKMRLKGDWTDHLLGEKWSYRIKVSGDNTIFGMKQFSIHHPKTRNFVYEWIYHQALKREGIINLRYRFVSVSLNGKDLGIYALEEHFEKRLIENNQYREGPIVKFAENLLWEDRATHHRQGMESPTGIGQETASAIDVFKENTVLDSPTLYRQFLTATTLIENFRINELPFHQAFDVDKMATFFALSDVMGAEHSVMWQNLRFYYNPVTALLEPVGFDANAGRKVVHVVGSNRSLTNPVYKFKDLAFSDTVFYEKYIQELERLSTPSYLDELFASVEQPLQGNLNILYQEFPYFHFSKKVFYDNQQAIKYALNPAQGLHAYYNDLVQNIVELEIGNIHALPIEVLDVTLANGPKMKPTRRLVLEAKDSYQPVDYHKSRFRLPSDFAWADSVRGQLSVNYKILGTSELRNSRIIAWPRRVETLLEEDFMRRPANVNTIDFLTVDESAKEIFVKPGAWKLGRDLIIGKGYQVIARAGTTIDLFDEAVILSYSALDFVGTEDAPIVIESSDSTGQGLVVLQADQPSQLQHVRFHNLSNPSKGGWQLTGAVTLYESEVAISRCQFVFNRCEDGLNIVRSRFTMDHVLFQDMQSDAFDGDWVNGKITNSVFLASGNDAVDVSGSNLEVENVLIDQAGDKGLSAGERSQLIARDVEVVNSEIAVASKDLSEIKIDGLRISGCQVGFTIYQKKPEFGPAKIAVSNLTKENLKVPFLLEPTSQLVIDGSDLAANAQHVESILYGVEFGKASKHATN